MSSPRTTALLLAALSCLPGLALAADPPGTLVVPAAAGQQALAVQVDPTGIHARACAALPCEAASAPLIALAEGARPRFERAKLEAITLEGGRALARIDAPTDAEGAGSFVALVAAPLAGKGSDPIVLWSGFIGATRGEAGEEHGEDVVVERSAKGGARVLVGERRADVSLCGRPALVGARAVDPAKLALVRGASFQNLSAEDRAKAPKVKATREREAGVPSTGPAVAQVLKATAASSAYAKKLAAITDGDLATAWSENKIGDGRGELVTMSAPDEVGITAIDLVIRPSEDVPDGAAPRRFYLATPDALVEVTMPEDAWQKPAGTRYSVKLPVEIHTSCLAVVLDEAFGGGRADPRVTIAEVSAHTAFDAATPEALAGALVGGEARAKAAAALLMRSGPPGVAAVIGAYDKLDERGRELARGVVDSAPCPEQVPFFAGRFAWVTGPGGAPRPAPGEVDPELAHSRDRLRRCGRASAAALVDLVAHGGPRTRVMAAEELAALAPAEAVPALVAALSVEDDAVRRDLRAALARAANNPRAAAALTAELASERLASRSETVAIDLLRASGPSIARVGAGSAFTDVAARATSLRARYLLQGPAADLAAAGDVAAAAYLERSLVADTDAHVRARAAEMSGRVPSLAARLSLALDDTDPRVREAAVLAIGEVSRDATNAAATAAAISASPGLRKRLSDDDWTFVRAGAARALSALPADVETDRALAAALADRSPEVREEALDGLGAHHAVAHADAVRERQDNVDEVLEVRARAILALGAMCDAKSAADWTKLAHAGKSPQDDKDRRLAGAAISALGHLHPKDLAERLAPLLDKDTPPAAREMAKAALAAPPGCP